MTKLVFNGKGHKNTSTAILGRCLTSMVDCGTQSLAGSAKENRKQWVVFCDWPLYFDMRQ